MRIGTHGRSLAIASIPSVHRIHQTMRDEGMVPVVDKALAEQLAAAGMPLDAGTEIAENPANAGIEVFFSLGGDGTFLDSVAKVGRSGIPVLGINLGRLGFLSSTREEGALLAIRDVRAGRYTVEDRGLLSVQGEGLGDGSPLFALNEVSVHKRDSSSMLAVEAFVDDRFLNTYWSDGLIVATPTGSTAYSLSCGGPIVLPNSGNFVITPVAPHNLNLRPIVLSDQSVISFEIEGRADNFICTLDSRFELITSKHQLAVRRNDFKIKLVQLQDTTFLQTLREKLTWGADMRN